MSALGLCPTCERPGPVAEPCRTPACARRGQHCIPEAWRPDPKRPLDGLIGQKRGDYLLVRRIGTGGVGTVYLALQCPLLMETALKLFTDTSSHLGARFEAEASALARLRHPNVVRLLQYGLHDEQPFLVMEYVPGERTLQDAMRRPMPRDDAFDIVRQTALALEAAHLVDVVHRDIKPANIMLQALPGQPHYVRLVDFGLAKFVDTGGSTQLMAGTPRYMAPEQMTQRNIGPWTDWYALGVIAFELFTGHRPFGEHSAQQIALLKARPEYDPTADLPPDAISAALRGFLRGVLAHDPQRRPVGATAFIDGLRAALEGVEPLAATRSMPLSPVEPARAADPPRRRWWIAGALALLALVAGAVAFGLPDEASDPSGDATASAIVPPAPDPGPVDQPTDAAAPADATYVFTLGEGLTLDGGTPDDEATARPRVRAARTPRAPRPGAPAPDAAPPARPHFELRGLTMPGMDGGAR